MNAARIVDRRSKRLTALFIALVTVAVAVPGLYLTFAPPAAAEDASARRLPQAPDPVEAKPKQQVEFLPPVSSSEARIQAALNEMTNLTFHELPLSDVFEFIEAKHNVALVADHKAIEDSAVDFSALVTIDLKNVRLRSALRLILRQYELAYVIRDEVLLITTQEEAEQYLVVRTYPVGDLVSPLTPILPARPAEEAPAKPEAKAPAEVGSEAKCELSDDKSGDTAAPAKTNNGGAGGMGGGFGGMGGGMGGGGSAPRRQNTPTAGTNQYGPLINALTSTIEPDSWDDAGGSGSVVPFQVSRSLVISQRQDVHEQVLELLRSLRAAKMLEK